MLNLHLDDDLIAISCYLFFFFNETATTEIYTLSLHDALPIFHANIQKDGTFSVVPRIRGGVTSAKELRRIADVADKYQVPMVKITGSQRIDLLGVKKSDLPKKIGRAHV